ncbi:EscR/YscR/HrcR family type III secretion system export apparatus protein [bacterium]|nr:EscR/YscR/HrcR family type III secretion system export apparatus protein [bacterium]
MTRVINIVTKYKSIFIAVLVFIAGTAFLFGIENSSVPVIKYDMNLFPELSPQLRMFLGLTFIVFLPFVILSVTPFVKVLIILLFLRRAISLPNIPQNTVVFSLAFFITISLVFPTMDSINKTVLFPYINGEISSTQLFNMGTKIIKKNLIRDNNFEMIKFLSGQVFGKRFKNADELPMSLIISSYLFNQIKKGFLFGTLIYLPFFVIDIAIAAVLISMGMIMLPPTFISIPFKILVFLSIGGWNFLIIKIFEL